MEYQKIDCIKRPLIKGELLLVPCIVNETKELHFSMSTTREKIRKIIEITPVFNLPHSDKENGQNEVHYHTDYRFIKCDINSISGLPYVKRTHRTHKYAPQSRVILNKGQNIEYILLPVINPNAFHVITDIKFISKSKLKHNCIHKGRCPHRGYDLSQVDPVDEVITCPLHGLKFNAKNKQIINI